MVQHSKAIRVGPLTRLDVHFACFPQSSYPGSEQRLQTAQKVQLINLLLQARSSLRCEMQGWKMTRITAVVENPHQPLALLHRTESLAFQRA